jgi:hypothetical protein
MVNPYPWQGYGFTAGKGRGEHAVTDGLPVLITTFQPPHSVYDHVNLDMAYTTSTLTTTLTTVTVTTRIAAMMRQQ